MKRYNCTYLILFMGLFFSCNTEEPKLPTDSSIQGNNKSHNSGTSQTEPEEPEEEYYFKYVSWASLNIPPEAGSIQMYFECNQEYIISISGNITGLRVSPTYGEGSGYVTAYFDEVEYKDKKRKFNVTWSESGTITFWVKEGPKNNYREVYKNFYLYRRGSKQNV